MPMREVGFSGSYQVDDVEFLLRRLELVPLPAEARERLISSGERHYSEMIGTEDRPSRERMRLFRQCMRLNEDTLAKDLISLAQALSTSAIGGKLTIVSIARAGTPIGVIVRRLLLTRWGWQPNAVRHYSISVIRDFGVDRAALLHIISRHPATSVRFLDGWTGKGTIADEIQQSIAGDTRLCEHVDPGLWVPLDISGVARWAANDEDYLMPSAVLGGTVSGLVSRSVLPAEDRRTARWHGCVELPQLRKYDVSKWFASRMVMLGADRSRRAGRGRSISEGLQARCDRFVDALVSEFNLPDRNRVKIGIGETVRAALRRVPDRIVLRDLGSADSQLVCQLAALREITVEVRPDMPVAAAALIITSRHKCS